MRFLADYVWPEADGLSRDAEMALRALRRSPGGLTRARLARAVDGLRRGPGEPTGHAGIGLDMLLHALRQELVPRRLAVEDGGLWFPVEAIGPIAT